MLTCHSWSRQGDRMMNNHGKVIVFRYDPQISPKVSYDTFEEVPYKDLTVLNVLDYIYNELDPSLAFRGRLCTKGYCGGCGVMVNNRPCLPCQSLAAAEMTIEPHPSFKIIKDLVCDWDRTDDNSNRLGPIAKPYPAIIVDPDKCVHCADCVLICPVGVYEKVNKKVLVVHNERCLGRSCQLCSDACWKTAISIKE